MHRKPATDGPRHLQLRPDSEGTHAGPLAPRRRLARLIADDEQLAG